MVMIMIPLNMQVILKQKVDETIVVYDAFKQAKETNETNDNDDDNNVVGMTNEICKIWSVVK